MRWKKMLKDYFLFTKKERIGAIAILILTLVIWIAPKMASPVKNQSPNADTEWMTAISQLQNNSISEAHDQNDASHHYVKENHTDSYNPVSTAGRQLALFYFDPNTLSAGGWKHLGISDKAAATIQHYLAKGGRFRSPYDLRRIYGLSASECDTLLPFVRIVTQAVQPSTKVPLHDTRHTSFTTATIDINTGDTAMFISLPGIGSKLAARIINFRERLGGFCRIDQVGELYGLSDSVFQKIKPHLILKDNSVKQIDINTAGKDELKQHPYIRWQLANAIVEYRNQHGNYSTLTDLKRLSAVNDSIYNKISPYLGL